MSRDVAGNYVFTIGDFNLRVMRMDVMQQQEFAVKARPVLDETGAPLIYSEDVLEFQKWFLPKLQHESGPDTWEYLTPAYINTLLKDHELGAVNMLNRIYVGALTELFNSFFPTGQEPQQVSKVKPEEDSKSTDSKPKLSKTLQQSPQS